MGEKIKQTAKNVINMAGSVMEIYPVQEKYVIQNYCQGRKDIDALRQDWERVGKTLSQIITQEASKEHNA